MGENNAGERGLLVEGHGVERGGVGGEQRGGVSAFQKRADLALPLELEKAARPPAQLAGIDVEAILRVAPIGVADAVLIPQRSAGIQALHAAHEGGIEVNPPSSPGYCAGP
ncbi:MAG: hypothetical protein ACRERE_05005 [Candidatus Entotheonellia bacterium]